jgi:hypothetical protein
MADSPALTEQVQAPYISTEVENREPAPARPEIAGKMTITRYEGGLPVLNWKSANQQPVKGAQKYLGEDTFIGMSVGSLALLALKVTGVVIAGSASAAAALPFGATMLATVLGGAVIGSLFNAKRMEKQEREGIEFVPPTTPNKGTALGLMQGTVMGAGMTILAGTLLHSVLGAGATGFFAQAAAVMAPSALAGGTLLTGLAAASMFTLPLIMAAGVGLYMAHKRGEQHAQMQETQYQHAAQIMRVQEGHVEGRAPVAELETHLAQTRNRNYTPEAATVAGVAIGAAALSALGANVHNEAIHAAGHVGNDLADHAVMHATHHAHQNAANTASTFASRFASNAGDASKTFADRVANSASATPDVSFADKINAARQAQPIPSVATLG